MSFCIYVFKYLVAKIQIKAYKPNKTGRYLHCLLVSGESFCHTPPGFSHTPPSLRATSPNLGEELACHSTASRSAFDGKETAPPLSGVPSGELEMDFLA
jgi:hypothetical protein